MDIELGKPVIIIQHPHLPREISGVATYVDILARSLREDLGFDARVISSAQSSRRARFRAVRASDVIHLNSNDLWMLGVAKLMRKRVVLKLHYLTYQSLHFSYIPMVLRRRLASEVAFLWRTYGRKGRLRIFVEATARLALRVAVMLSADRVVACSDFLAESTGLKRISTIYNPARVTVAQVPPLLPQNQQRALCFVGRLTWDKGCDLLLDAVASLGKSDFPINVVGDGEQMATLQAQAKTLGLTNVVFLGRLSSFEVASVLSDALALVVPSRWQEPAGYTPVEASLSGCPSIAARVGGLTETAGPHALYFSRESVSELAGQIAYAIDNPIAMSGIGADSKEYAIQKFAPRAIAGQFLLAAEIH
jgi:glycogen(starch) synthase